MELYLPFPAILALVLKGPRHHIPKRFCLLTILLLSQFIRALDIPYCPLYDKGYTSLGGTDDTHPNPVLKSGDEEKSDHFRPAYELIEDHEERLGRN